MRGAIPVREQSVTETGSTAVSPRAGASRLAWTVGDQVLSSGTNFALGIVIARMVSLREFGVFTLVYATYQIALGIARALVSEPLVVRFSLDDLMHKKDPVKSATGASLLIGAVLGAMIVVVSLLFRGDTRFAFVVLGVGLPTLLLQDSWRFVFFAAGLPRRATINDAIWTVAQFALILTVTASGRPRMPVILAAWCAAGVIAAVAGVVQARALPSFRQGFAWVSSTRDLSSRFVTEFTIGNGTSQVLFWLVSLTAGILAAAALRAAQLLLGPPRVVVQAAYSAIVPEGVRLRRSRPGEFPIAVLILATVLAGGTALWGALFMVLPWSVGHALLGASWKAARPLIPLLTVAATAFGAQTAAIAALRVLAAANRSLRARAITSPVSLAVAVLGGAVDGARGAAIGVAAGSLFAASVTWLQWRAELAGRAAGGRR